MYELVRQAYHPQVSSATSAACDSNSNVTYFWYRTDRQGQQQQWKRVTQASFFVEDLGLAVAPKMCSDKSQAFKEVSNSQAFP